MKRPSMICPHVSASWDIVVQSTGSPRAASRNRFSRAWSSGRTGLTSQLNFQVEAEPPALGWVDSGPGISRRRRSRRPIPGPRRSAALVSACFRLSIAGELLLRLGRVSWRDHRGHGESGQSMTFTGLLFAQRGRSDRFMPDGRVGTVLKPDESSVFGVYGAINFINGDITRPSSASTCRSPRGLGPSWCCTAASYGQLTRYPSICRVWDYVDNGCTTARIARCVAFQGPTQNRTGTSCRRRSPRHGQVLHGREHDDCRSRARVRRSRVPRPWPLRGRRQRLTRLRTGLVRLRCGSLALSSPSICVSTGTGAGGLVRVVVGRDDGRSGCGRHRTGVSPTARPMRQAPLRIRWPR